MLSLLYRQATTAGWPLPDRLYLRCTNLPVATDERYAQRKRRGGYNSIRQVRDFAAVYGLEGIRDQTIEWRQQTRSGRVI